MSKREGRWRFSAGCRPYTVTAYEREPGGVLYARCRDPSLRSGKRVVSLGHCDRDRARRYAVEQAAALQCGADEITASRTRLDKVVALYLRHRTPRKSGTGQTADRRRAELWIRVLGADRNPESITQREWEAFISDRQSGRINARGQRVNTAHVKPVRTRVIEADLKWLLYLLGWATRWKEGGHYVLRENPVRGFEIPREKNPRRPVASEDRCEALEAVAGQVRMEIRWQHKREIVPSYLPALIAIAKGTGRRLSPICQLRYDDLRLSESRYGAIRWPADTDKQGQESVVPISLDVRAAIESRLGERPVIGMAYLFPSPTDPNKPITRHLARHWLRRAEKLAGLEPLQGSAWHAFRRKWATERKHLSAIDVAAAGGWKAVETLQRVYQQADQETMLHVVLSPAQLREAR